MALFHAIHPFGTSEREWLLFVGCILALGLTYISPGSSQHKGLPVAFFWRHCLVLLLNEYSL